MKTQHNHGPNFGKRIADCPRCQELNNGSEPRKSWHAAYFTRQKLVDTQRLEAIRNHNFAACEKRNIVCTCFDN